MKRFAFLIVLLLLPLTVVGKPADLDAKKVHNKMQEILKEHAVYKKLTPEIVKRSLNNYLEELDPAKTYFIAPDVYQWTNPSDEFLTQTLDNFNKSDYSVFEEMQHAFVKAVERRKKLDKEIDINNLPKGVKASEFKDMKWVQNEDELLEKLKKIKSLQLEAAGKLTDEVKDKSLQRLAKNQQKFEDERISNDPKIEKKVVYTFALKSLASALDNHTVYFTPEEASQFLIEVQKRLFGIGAQLRDDLNGFTVVKIVEGGPAAKNGLLKAKDRIIAINGEPVVGMNIVDAVDLIRGEENTPVELTVIREGTEGDKKTEKQLNITINRGEVVLTETRYESSYEPFGKGAIGYLRLFSFYQDPESSSATDLLNALTKLKEKHNLEGVILDLRNNTGGMLTQAVAVTGLFITKGIVVSIKESDGEVQHLRHLDGKTAFDGPLIVLVNRLSASAAEIVAQTLQDYGRAIIVGDDHTYGKGSFQTFTLNPSSGVNVNPEGEYKVSRGLYYTVSGKTPQLTGVHSDIVLPGPFYDSEIGEKYSKYPLPSDNIKENFDDDLSDIPFLQRNKVKLLYKFNLQPKIDKYTQLVPVLKENEDYRVEHNKTYQKFIKDLKKKDKETTEEITVEEEEEPFGNDDLQLQEAYNIMKDLIFLLDNKEVNDKKVGPHLGKEIQVPKQVPALR